MAHIAKPLPLVTFSCLKPEPWYLRQRFLALCGVMHAQSKRCNEHTCDQNQACSKVLRVQHRLAWPETPSIHYTFDFKLTFWLLSVPKTFIVSKLFRSPIFSCVTPYEAATRSFKNLMGFRVAMDAGPCECLGWVF